MMDYKKDNWNKLTENSEPKRISAILYYGAIIIGIIFMGINAVKLREALERTTDQYVVDVTDMLSEDIATRIRSYLRSTEQLADTLYHTPYHANYLEHKARKLDFEQFFIISGDEAEQTSIPGVADPMEDPAIKQAFAGKTAISYTDEESILYAAPIGDGEAPEQILAGICGRKRIKKLIASANFEGKGVACILDRNGNMIIGPTELQLFESLRQVLQESGYEQRDEVLQQMLTDLYQGQSGSIEVTSSMNRNLLISYSSLQINGWMLATIVPADLITGEATEYTVYNFVLLGVILLIQFIFLVRSLAQYRANRMRLVRLAFRDSLTSGMNHAGFQAAYERIAAKLETNEAFLVLINIRGFRRINTSFGKKAGDETLRYIYRLLLESLHVGEIVARSEMDHYLCLLKGGSQEEIKERIQKLMEKIKGSYSIRGGNDFQLQLVWGAYQIEDPDMDFVQVEERSRTALKFRGVLGGCFYDAGMMKQIQQEEEINTLFDGSLENHDFEVYYQPKIRLSDDRIGGAEALVRWNHPTRGMISPGVFIPVLEKSQNICRLDRYVFEETCRFQAMQMQEGKELFPISINLSRLHFLEDGFLEEYIAIKEKYQIPDGMLELEMTESIYLDPAGRKSVKETLHRMHEYGFLCSLDDFGVGFSSLGMLQELEVDTIKLDRQFFVDVTLSKNQAVINSLMDLAEMLHIETISEGIETQIQLEFLRGTSCNMVQGYIFSKPLPEAEFKAYADDH